MKIDWGNLTAQTIMSVLLVAVLLKVLPAIIQKFLTRIDDMETKHRKERDAATVVCNDERKLDRTQHEKTIGRIVDSHEKHQERLTTRLERMDSGIIDVNRKVDEVRREIAKDGASG